MFKLSSWNFGRIWIGYLFDMYLLICSVEKSGFVTKKIHHNCDVFVILKILKNTSRRKLLSTIGWANYLLFTEAGHILQTYMRQCEFKDINLCKVKIKVKALGWYLVTMIFLCPKNPEIHCSPVIYNVQDKTKNLLYKLV